MLAPPPGACALPGACEAGHKRRRISRRARHSDGTGGCALQQPSCRPSPCSGRARRGRVRFRHQPVHHPSQSSRRRAPAEKEPVSSGTGAGGGGASPSRSTMLSAAKQPKVGAGVTRARTQCGGETREDHGAMQRCQPVCARACACMRKCIANLTWISGRYLDGPLLEPLYDVPRQCEVRIFDNSRVHGSGLEKWHIQHLCADRSGHKCTA